ncbi:DDE-type integrase/transposase/recombinase [Streptomyces niveus]|uniref:DDE-type integrase/transposase/recombinase n=1 Tax=Streptomyces niveus TaxID=193462 RepID=UPI0036D37EBA
MHIQLRCYGARKIWHEPHRQGYQVARCTVERLMREFRNVGVVRGRKIITTVPGGSVERPPDLVDRKFVAAARSCVADFTHVKTWSGVVYVAFVVDTISRLTVGWSAATSKETRLVLDFLDMALWQRDREEHPHRHGRDPCERRRPPSPKSDPIRLAPCLAPHARERPTRNEANGPLTCCFGCRGGGI